MNKNITRLTILLPFLFLWIIGNHEGDYAVAYLGCSVFWFFVGGIFVKNIDKLRDFTRERGINTGG